MSTPPITTYRSRLDEIADKYLFGSVFLIGTGLIILLKKLNTNAILVTVVPVAAILIYALYVLRSPRYRIRNDRAGDSLYYLGFLFTMVSLAYSLYEFSGSKGTESIVTNFGIALSTTIAGLVLRVVYHQLREDPFEVEREVRIELAEAAGKLRGELLSAASNFKAVSTASVQTLEEISKTANSQVARVVEQSSATYSKAVSELSDLVSASAAEMRKQQTSMRQAGNGAALAMEKLAERLDRISFPVDHITTQIGKLTEEITTSLKKLAERGRADQEHVAELQKLISDTELAVGKLGVQITSIERDAGRYGETSKAIGSVLQQLAEAAKITSSATIALQEEHLKSQAKLLRELEATTGDAARAAREHRTALEKDVATSSELLTQVHQSLISLTRTIIEKVDA